MKTNHLADPLGKLVDFVGLESQCFCWVPSPEIMKPALLNLMDFKVIFSY